MLRHVSNQDTLRIWDEKGSVSIVSSISKSISLSSLKSWMTSLAGSEGADELHLRIDSRTCGHIRPFCS
jgi:hypothetical protein